MGSKLYVANLNYNSTAQDISEFFAEIGEVEDVQLITDRDTGRSRGFAFVTMASEEDAQTALDTLNGQDFSGRPLVVKEARPRENDRGGGKGRGGGGGGGGGFRGNSPGNSPGGGGGGRKGRGGGGGGWSDEDDWGRSKSGKKKGKPRQQERGGRRKKGGSWSDWSTEDF